jgi:hypothetical protein
LASSRLASGAGSLKQESPPSYFAPSKWARFIAGTRQSRRGCEVLHDHVQPALETIKAGCLKAIRETMDADERPLMTVKEASLALALSPRWSKTHVSHALAGKLRGIPRLTHIATGQRKIASAAGLDQWMEAIKRQ